VVDVATHLTAQSRKNSRRRGKDDEGDAIAIARVALRESGLPRMDADHLDADVKLLVDARDQLVAEQTRTRNRLHALLIGMVAGHRAETGALISNVALQRARSLALKARRQEPIRARLALAAIRRLHAISAEITALETAMAGAIKWSHLNQVQLLTMDQEERYFRSGCCATGTVEDERNVCRALI